MISISDSTSKRKKQKKGIMVLIYTPLNHDDSLNETAIHVEIDWVNEQGATCIWPGGFAGHWPEMDEDLR